MVFVSHGGSCIESGTADSFFGFCQHMTISKKRVETLAVTCMNAPLGMAVAGINDVTAVGCVIISGIYAVMDITIFGRTFRQRSADNVGIGNSGIVNTYAVSCVRTNVAIYRYRRVRRAIEKFGKAQPVTVLCGKGFEKAVAPLDLG